MSTRVSLKYEVDETTRQEFHLYRDVFDDDHVYLEVIGVPFEAASSLALSGLGPSRVAIQLPLAWASKLGLLEP